MIITCEKCETRFNLDESLLNADGSTVRCSRCQHIFTASPPPGKPEFDDPGFQDIDLDKDLALDDPDFDKDTDLPEMEEADLSEMEETDLPGIRDDENLDNVQEELELGDISSDDSEPEFDLAFDLDEKEGEDDVSDGLDEKEDEDDVFDGLDEFDDPDFEKTDMEDTDPSDAPSHEPPPPRRPARASLIHPLDPEDEPMESEKRPAKKRAAIGSPVLVLILLFLLAGGGYIAATFLGYKIPFLPEIQIPFIEQYLPEKTPEIVSYPDPIPDQKSVTGRFIANDNAGELFIITGKIENPAQIPYRRIQVKGTLFQKEKTAAMSQIAFCGNIIPEKALKTGRIEDLITQLKIPGGTADINEKIMPGDFVPFMLVFADLPRNLENFTVEVAGFEKATP